MAQCERNVDTAEKVVIETTKINISEVSPNEKAGYIAGNVCYPADGIPSDLKIYASNLNTNKIYMFQISTINDPAVFVSDKKYKMRVPEGDYYVYAMSSHVASKRNYKAYYSESVVCGLQANCTSHEPIAVTVQVEKTTNNIDPCDWYDLTQRH